MKLDKTKLNSKNVSGSKLVSPAHSKQERN